LQSGIVGRQESVHVFCGVSAKPDLHAAQAVLFAHVWQFAIVDRQESDCSVTHAVLVLESTWPDAHLRHNELEEHCWQLEMDAWQASE
jgi:hypothetical protein